MNQQYANPRFRRGQNAFNWLTMSVKIAAWSGPYVFVETHVTVAEIVSHGGSNRAVSMAILGKTVSPLGYAASDPALFTPIGLSAPVTFLTLVEDNAGAFGTWPVLAYYDTGIGLPFTPNGLEWLIQPDWLAERGWFRC